MKNWTNDTILVKEIFDKKGMSGVIDVEFISVWDDGFEVVSDAKFDIDNNNVFSIKPGCAIDDEGDEVQILIDEFIEIPNVGRFLLEETLSYYKVVEAELFENQQ